MAVAVDASTPIRWTGVWDANVGGSITSAAFTAPADALLVLCAEVDTRSDSTNESLRNLSASDSGSLTWTTRVERRGAETTAGAHSAIFTARTTSSASRTLTLTGSNPDDTGDWGSGRASAKCYVCTGVDVDGTPVDTVGASNEGGSGTNNLTTSSITPGANGLLFAADADWNALGTFEASDDLTQDTAHYAGGESVCDGYKAVTSGVGATANLDAAGTGTPQHKWCQVIVREAPSAAAPTRPMWPVAAA